MKQENKSIKDKEANLYSLRTQKHPKIITKSASGLPNGYLIPIYNENEPFFEKERRPKQVYLTAVAPQEIKGPHLHFIRTGFFTCIKGNIRVVVKTKDGYCEYYSGEDYEYCSIEIPPGVPAVIQNISNDNALVLNMPSPAWTPDMNDEHTADFGDYNFNA